MSVMASARDLITLFVALETISIPTFILAAFRKHDRRVERSGREVLPDRRAVVGADALRHVADLRRHRRDEARPSISRVRVGSHGTTPLAHGRDLPLARRVRVQGRARCRSTSGRPTPTRARPRRSPRSCRSRRRPAGSSRCINIVYFGFFGPNGRGADAWWPVRLGARGAVDDARQPRRAAPDQHRAHAGLLVDRAGRVHARAVRGGRHRGRRRRIPTSPRPR